MRNNVILHHTYLNIIIGKVVLSHYRGYSFFIVFFTREFCIISTKKSVKIRLFFIFLNLLEIIYIIEDRVTYLLLQLLLDITIDIVLFLPYLFLCNYINNHTWLHGIFNFSLRKQWAERACTQLNPHPNTLYKFVCTVYFVHIPFLLHDDIMISDYSESGHPGNFIEILFYIY